jgi:hypothetical protein
LIARPAQIGLLSALLASATLAEAEPDGLNPGRLPWLLGLDLGIARRLAELPTAMHGRGLTVGLDAAPDDQQAGETLGGASNLTTLGLFASIGIQKGKPFEPNA